MTSRVVLVSPATSQSLRQARFDDGGSLDTDGRACASAVAGSLPPAARVVVSPGVRCRETAGSLGLEGAEAAELAGLEAGRRRGRNLAEVAVTEPEAVGRWLTDPSSAPHGGESVRDACARVGRWLDALRETDGRALPGG
ncbi:histidine phosphatase family protein [Streptomyces massasporeus]|uniref:Histidine phosphatase family protein n=1 Tax=Streptomyces massasporeus TaxID=67324 RepID=A0ABW6LHV9_9ACTN